MKVSLFTAIASLAAISCGAKESSLVGPFDGGTGAGGAAVIACSNDGQCGSSGACFAKRCVERLGRMDNWAVEITPPPATIYPPPERGIYGPLVTELPSVGAPPVVLQASPALPLVVRFETNAPTDVPSPATVVVTVPSRIPGRPDLSFQADLQVGSSATTPSATLTVSDVVLGQQATVTLIPLPPADVNIPPYTFPDKPISMSGPMIAELMVPPPSFKISGRLIDALDKAKGNFTVRAFQGGVFASTTGVTSAADGSFTILLPAGSGPVNLELLPGSGAADPWMTLPQLPLTAAPKDLGPISLPAYLLASAFRITVRSDSADRTPVPGASVRAIADLNGGDTRGKTRFLRDGSTDANGNTQLTLIPGDSQAPLMYTVSVAPPPGSPWATRCKRGVAVLYNGSGTPTNEDFMLARRPVVSGTLLSAEGTAVADALVTATRGPSADSDCLLGPTTTSVITDATGAFQIALDSGDEYQLDYDPPAGSAAPRWTEYHFSVGADVPKTVRLPRPALFEGDVVNADGNKLGSTTIRIFEPQPCPPPYSCWLPPLLRGQTQSDADGPSAGHFRVIVAAPSAAN